MHEEIFITELLGAEIKQQMASHRVAVTPPNTVSHLLHKRQVGLHKIRVGPQISSETWCPWEAHHALMAPPLLRMY